MSSQDPSPCPWRAIHARILDARGKTVCVCEKDSMHGMSDDETAKYDAVLIVDAVNNADSWRDACIKARTERNAFLLERDRLRDLMRRLVDLFTPGTIHPDGTMERLLREARAAIGEVAQ